MNGVGSSIRPDSPKVPPCGMLFAALALFLSVSYPDWWVMLYGLKVSATPRQPCQLHVSRPWRGISTVRRLRNVVIRTDQAAGNRLLEIYQLLHEVIFAVPIFSSLQTISEQFSSSQRTSLSLSLSSHNMPNFQEVREPSTTILLIYI
jgi:hypothetical protein